MRGQRSDLLVAVDRVTVVDQQPHAHATVGGAQQGIGQQAAGFVLAKNEVFEIDRPLGGIQHLRSRKEPGHPRRENAEAGVSAMPARRGHELATELGLLRLRQCIG